MSPHTLTIVLAGGKGARLEPLTNERAKPAVPFAGGYRIIDFALSNCINSGLLQLLMLTQYKSLSLERHLELAWKPLFQRELGAYLDVIPPQHRITEDWYRGTADAVYQNIYSIERARAVDVLILGGDHVYAMDYRGMLQFHRENRADVTLGAIEVPVTEAAHQFGVVQSIDRNGSSVLKKNPLARYRCPITPDMRLPPWEFMYSMRRSSLKRSARMRRQPAEDTTLVIIFFRMRSRSHECLRIRLVQREEVVQPIGKM